MNRDQLIDEINKTKEHLANMEKMLAEWKYERWKPEDGEDYYYIKNSDGEIWKDVFYHANNSDNIHYNTYNCFRTREQAEVEVEKILVRRQLENIAKRLNGNTEIIWDPEDLKYYLVIDTNDNIDIDFNRCTLIQGVVYCLDRKFKDAAIQEIGEERLKRYLKGR